MTPLHMVLVTGLFLVTVTDTIKRFDLREVGINFLELLAQALDMAVDGTVIDIDAFAIGRIHKLVAVLHVAGALGQSLYQQEFGYGKIHFLALPGAAVATAVEHELAANQNLPGLFLFAFSTGAVAAQKRTDAF